MNTRSFLVFLTLFALSACTQSPLDTTPTPLAATVTPTLYLGSPVPGETAVALPLPSFTPITQQSFNGSTDTYAVINVLRDDLLNIRSGPGVENAVVGTLESNQSGLTRTGKVASVGEDTWDEIQNPDGGTGWVNADFLTEYVNPAPFCADGRVTTLLQNLKTAVNTTDGELFKSLISPAHGLDVVYVRGGTVANYSPEEAGWVFQSTYEVNWGAGAGSGEPVKGTFPGIVLPALQDVFKNETLTCDEIKHGGATYEVEWPSEYSNINFYSLYNPGLDPSSNGLDWRTWLAGIEYTDGQPYLFALLNYQWEP
jgi:Bacterial SH3 domain